MDGATLVGHLATTLWLVLLLSLPALGVATVVGLIVGLLQAVTQIQDQALPQTVKIIAVLVTLLLTGALLAGPLIRHTERLLDEFPALTR
jgi:type III secretion protein S